MKGWCCRYAVAALEEIVTRHSSSCTHTLKSPKLMNSSHTSRHSLSASVSTITTIALCSSYSLTFLWALSGRIGKACRQNQRERVNRSFTRECAAKSARGRVLVSTLGAFSRSMLSTECALPESCPLQEIGRLRRTAQAEIQPSARVARPLSFLLWIAPPPLAPSERTASS